MSVVGRTKAVTGSPRAASSRATSSPVPLLAPTISTPSVTRRYSPRPPEALG